MTEAGKGSWVTPRDGTILVKGKESPLQTYWVRLSSESVNGSSETRSTLAFEEEQKLPVPSEGLVDRNVKMLMGLLKKIAARRGNSDMYEVIDEQQFTSTTDSTAFDELAEVIALPKLDQEAISHSGRADDVELDPRVQDEVR